MLNAARGSARWIAVIALTALVTVVPFAASESASAATSDACGARIAKPGGGLWSCSFVDDFAGTRLDTSRWVVGDSATGGFHMNSTCFKTGQNVAVGGGQLKLSVRRTAPFACQVPGGSVPAVGVGGGVSTYGKFAQAYGRFEARVKYPSHTGVGLHSNFWMNPQVRTYGAWPASGEIDVAEWFSGFTGRVYPSLHYTGRTTADSGRNCAVARPDMFHTYTLVWGPTTMQFLIDGALCFARSWTPTDMAAPKPFDKPFTAALTAGLGGGTNAPDARTPNLATTSVDYVKVWR
ncbi:glycoside hydrolase family 16 protein [Nocardioides sp.]|uniref:glycoside hydrolase family 16 protein n=1 Tax=Nocardioides sp. TaxID=35761 RepID=UPI002CEC3491|nr:glycoside hydrolase family 16 protein [Nocardioides sp.]HSX66976.1 glycoside hydrolase family 16 protein [Nocardioides sp.]